MKYRLLPSSEVGVEEWPRRAEQDIAEMFIHFDALGRSMSSRAERIPLNQRYRTAVTVLNCCDPSQQTADHGCDERDDEGVEGPVEGLPEVGVCAHRTRERALPKFVVPK